jgi:hypothetical protein
MKNSATRQTSNAIDIAPLAALSLFAAGAATAAYLTRLARHSSGSAEKHHSLIAYLRDHLTGADSAIQLVRRLSSTYGDTQDGQLFRQLADEFEQDRETVRFLLMRLGASPRSLKRVAGHASGFVLSLAAGGKSESLSLLRTLEGLAMGIQGKRCMWRALQELGTVGPTGRESFSELESRALRQWDRIEQRRRALAATTFPTFGAGTRSRSV